MPDRDFDSRLMDYSPEYAEHKEEAEEDDRES